MRLVSPVVNRLGRRLGPARAHRASVIAGCGLPPCVLGIRAHYHEETASGCSARAGEHLVHPDTCEACTWRDVCSGLWPEYVEVHGVHDIRPVLADPLETVR